MLYAVRVQLRASERGDSMCAVRRRLRFLGRRQFSRRRRRRSLVAAVVLVCGVIVSRVGLFAWVEMPTEDRRVTLLEIACCVCVCVCVGVDVDVGVDQRRPRLRVPSPFFRERATLLCAKLGTVQTTLFRLPATCNTGVTRACAWSLKQAPAVGDGWGN